MSIAPLWKIGRWFGVVGNTAVIDIVIVLKKIFTDSTDKLSTTKVS